MPAKRPPEHAQDSVTEPSITGPTAVRPLQAAVGVGQFTVSPNQPADSPFLALTASARRIALFSLPLAALMVAVLLWMSSGVLTYQDDAAQYMSTASHLLAGNGLRTSVMYYDSQLVQQAPAIQTVWPAGFPVLTALVSAVTGLPVARSLLLVAIFAHIGSAALLMFVIRLIGLGSWLALACAGFWLLFVPLWLGVSRGLSDPLYQFFGIASVVAVACYFRSGRDRTALDNGHRRWMLLASLAAMMAVLVRYQAIALIAPLFAAMTIGCFQSQPLLKRFLAGVLVCLPPAALLGLLFLRNYGVTGSLTGGAVSGRGQTLADVASRIGWVPEWLQMLTLIVLILSSLAAAIASAVLWVRDTRYWRSRPPLLDPGTRAVMVLCLGAYAANIVLLLYLCLTSTAYVIAMRYMGVCLLYLLPPLVWTASYWGGGRLVRASARQDDHRLAQNGLAAVIAMLTVVQLSGFQEPFLQRLETAPPGQLHRTLLANPVNQGSALALLKGLPGKEPVLMSTHAHSLSLLTNTTVVGVPVPIYTPKQWNEAEIRNLAIRHRVTYLVAFRGLETWVYRDLINKMLDANGCPQWLEPIVANPDLVIARVNSQNTLKGCDLPIPLPRPPVRISLSSGAAKS